MVKKVPMGIRSAERVMFTKTNTDAIKEAAHL